jgi:hypothetical protein
VDTKVNCQTFIAIDRKWAPMKGVAPFIMIFVLAVQSACAQPATLSPTDDHIDTVQVTAPKVPLDKAINNFVKSYPAPSVKADKIPKWASGICPLTEGLTPELNAGVSAYLKLIAAQVGAPIDKKVPCKANVTIIFTRTPQAVLDDIAKNHQDLLGYHEDSQFKSIATMNHPIQAWYATSTRDYNGLLHLDSAQQSPFCSGALSDLGADQPNSPEWLLDLHRVNQFCDGTNVSGSRVNDGLRSEFSRVTIIADFNKVDALGVKPVANYVAMLALSQTQAFETCQPLVSIANLLANGCDATLEPDGLSANDIAYLKALYKMDPDNMLLSQRSSIVHQMEANLSVH